MPALAFLVINLPSVLPIHIRCSTTIVSIMTAELLVCLYGENQENDPIKINPSFPSIFLFMKNFVRSVLGPAQHVTS